MNLKLNWLFLFSNYLFIFLFIFLFTTTQSSFAGTVKINDGTKGSGLNQYNFSDGWTLENGGDFFGNDQYWSGQYNEAGTNNAWFSIKFTGTKIELYGKSLHANGIGAVKIDNGPEVDVDFGSPDLHFQYLSYASPRLAMGTHTIKVRLTGRTDGYPAREAFVCTDFALVYDDIGPVDPEIQIPPSIPFDLNTKIEAENTRNIWLCTTTQSCDDNGGGKKISWVETKDAWAGYFVKAGASGFKVRASSSNSNGGTISIREGSPKGTVLGSVDVPGGKGWNDYTGTLSSVTKLDTLYLTFVGNGNWPHFDVNWVTFTGTSTTALAKPFLSKSNSDDVNLNQTSFFLIKKESVEIQILNLQGSVLYSEKIVGNKGLNNYSIPEISLPKGSFIFQVKSKKDLLTHAIFKNP